MLLVAGRLPISWSSSLTSDRDWGSSSGRVWGTALTKDEAVVAAGRLTGLSVADLRARLAGTLPRVLHIEGDPERAAETARALEELGFSIISCDPRAAPGDQDRLQARGLRFLEGRLLVTDPGGEQEDVPLSSLSLIQRGVRATTLTEVSKKTERRLDLTRAILSGGLMLTKKVETKATKTTTSRDGFLLLHRADGERDVIIYERRIDYRFLGKELQPSSAGNFERLVARLRELAPRAAYDDRLNRPGFLSGLPVPAGAAVDVALWLVQLFHLRGLAAPPDASSAVTGPARRTS